MKLIRGSVTVQNERLGEQIWKDFHDALEDRVWKVFGILPEGYILFRKAVESYDSGALEATVLLCRATLESVFQIFLSVQWYNESSFNIVYPTTTNGKLMDRFDDLLGVIGKRIPFSKDEMAAINRIHEHGNFVAHFASRKIKYRMARVEKFRRWERSHKNATDAEKVKIVNKIVRSEKSLTTREEALHDLRDTAEIMMRLGKV